jgi:hypothetical protein
VASANNYIAKLFTKSFWETDSREDSSEVLLAPKDIGHFFRRDRAGNMRPRKPDKKFVPPGYTLDRYDTVLKAKTTRSKVSKKIVSSKKPVKRRGRQ